MKEKSPNTALNPQNEPRKILLEPWERFSAGGITLNYPPFWTIGSRNVVDARRGELWFGPYSEGEIGGKLHIFWGPLEQMSQYSSVEKQARETLSSFQRDTMWSGGKAELLDLDRITIDGHEAYYARLKAIRIAPGILPFVPSRTVHEIEAAYLHCHDSNRYFTLVLEVPPDPSKVERHLADFTASFSCHSLALEAEESPPV